MKNVRLPYIDNAKAVLITVVINIAVVFIFNRHSNGVTFQDVLWDSLICAIITTTINMWFVFPRLKKLRATGQMPQQAPQSRLIQKLPKNPFAPGALYAFVFAVFTIGINALILRFFDLQIMTFAPWMVYKLIYATVLSIKIVEFCIFRYVQPDWAIPATTDATVKPVKNPMPKVSVFKEMYGSVTGNIALNIIIGSFLGSIVTQSDGSVVIFPNAVEGMPVSGLVFGCITGIPVSNSYIKTMKSTILSYGPPMLETAIRDRRFTWMPKRKGSLMCFVTLNVMIFSAVALPAIMHLFDKAFLNFYQYVILITVYAALISKPLSYILVKRCMQTDYIQHTLFNKARR